MNRKNPPAGIRKTDACRGIFSLRCLYDCAMPVMRLTYLSKPFYHENRPVRTHGGCVLAGRSVCSRQSLYGAPTVSSFSVSAATFLA